MSLSPGQKLNGPEKAAVLLLSLSEEYAGRIMSQLEDYEIRDVSLVMATLGSIPSDVVEKVYVEFAEGIFTGGQLVGTYNSTERALLKVMDSSKVESIMEEIRGPAGRTMWDKMGNIDEETLAGYLKNEYPQTIAVVLSKIKAGHAAKVISLLPEELAADVMLRLLKMDAVQKEILNDIEHTLKAEFMNDVTRASKKDPFEMLAAEISAVIIEKTFPVLSERGATDELSEFIKLGLEQCPEDIACQVIVSPQLQEDTQKYISRLVPPVKVNVESDPTFSITDCRIQWGQGGVERLTKSIIDQVTEGLSRLCEKNLELNLDGSVLEEADGAEEEVTDEPQEAIIESSEQGPQSDSLIE